MKPTLLFGCAVLAALCSAAPALAAQTVDSNGRMVVPLNHPNQPAVVKYTGLNGSITVHAGSAGQVTISGLDADRDGDNVPEEARGMRRLNSPAFSVDQDNNTLTVQSSVFRNSDIALEVPPNTSLTIKATNGSISITGVTGDFDVSSTNGRVTLDQVGGSIVAGTLNGVLNAVVTHLDTNKPSSFTSMNGRINVTLPADLHATLTVRSDQGDIYLDRGYDFHQATSSDDGGDVTRQRESDGMTKLNVQRTIHGTIGGGGVALTFRNFNAAIMIHKGQ